jgi:hypothetical protein
MAEAAGVEIVEPESGQSHSELMQDADEAQKSGDFEMAKSLLTLVRNKRRKTNPGAPEDPYIIQRLALVTYKSGLPSPEAALTEAQTILETLKPQTSNDTETLGLWGAIHKRLWDLKGKPEDLKEAVRAYERGFYLRNDYYNGINLAFLDNVSAASAMKRADPTVRLKLMPHGRGHRIFR